ncbi:MAG TPA: hypothetical protein VGJ73_18535 [Verrucomicrobiae bacterium]|jgi:hypothetical protein
MNSPQAKSPPNWTLIACAVFALFILLAIVTGRGLYADGSLYFLMVLKAGGFAPIIPCRDFATYVFQLPMAAALKLGINHIPWLIPFFGVGCFYAWPVAMLLCYRLASRHFWLVMLACAAGYLNTAFMAVGEHIVAHAFFWPALFAILFVRPLTPFAAGSLLLSGFILMRSYESYLFLGPLLTGLVVWRMVRDQERPWRQAVLAAAAACFVLAAYFAWKSVAHANARNYNSFKQGLFEQLAAPVWTVKMSFWWGLFMGGMMFPPIAKALKLPVAWILIVLFVLIWGAWPILAPAQLHPGLQYNCRFLDLLVPLALTPVAMLLAFKPNWLAAQTPDLRRLSAIMLVAQSLWHISATYQWQRTISSWKHLLAEKDGPIFLPRDRCFNDPDYSWANPCVSLLVGPERVRAMIMPDHSELWQPFDWLKPSTFPDLKRYGVDYTEYVDALNREKLNHDR